MDSLTLTVLVIVFALVFDISNGWNDSANSIATVVSTRVLRPLHAVIFGAVFNFVGALFSSAVAQTVGRDVANPADLTPAAFLAGAVVAPVWIAFCTWRGLPISCSHSLLGGLIGAVLAATGRAKAEGVQKILFGVFSSPIAGFVLGFALMVIVYWICRRLRPATVSRWFSRLQLVSAAAMAFSHGTGDAQKAMGIITGALISAKIETLGADGKMHIPLWVRLACASCMALGTAWGGWRVIRTLGMRLAHLRPVHGFAAETGGAITILVNTLTGVPISTTHSITGAIVGVGAVHGVRTVKWGIGAKIVFTWLVTFPVCIGGGWAICRLMELMGVSVRPGG